MIIIGSFQIDKIIEYKDTIIIGSFQTDGIIESKDTIIIRSFQIDRIMGSKDTIIIASFQDFFAPFPCPSFLHSFARNSPFSISLSGYPSF